MYIHSNCSSLVIFLNKFPFSDIRPLMKKYKIYHFSHIVIFFLNGSTLCLHIFLSNAEKMVIKDKKSAQLYKSIINRLNYVGLILYWVCVLGSLLLSACVLTCWRYRWWTRYPRWGRHWTGSGSRSPALRWGHTTRGTGEGELEEGPGNWKYQYMT